MTYRSSASLLLIASAVMLVIGFWRAAIARRWGLFAVTVIALVAYALVLLAIVQIPDAHLRIWTMALALILFPAWIMAGPIIFGMTTRPPDQLFPEEKKSLPSTKVRRYRGLITLVAGFLAWCYGAINSDLSGSTQVLLLGIALYGQLLGCYWLIGGRSGPWRARG
jgi:hypothetical protein